MPTLDKGFCFKVAEAPEIRGKLSDAHIRLIDEVNAKRKELEKDSGDKVLTSLQRALHHQVMLSILLTLRFNSLSKYHFGNLVLDRLGAGIFSAKVFEEVYVEIAESFPELLDSPE